MSRRQSIFASTKQIVQSSAVTIEEVAMLSTDLVRLGRAEIKASAKLNQLENSIEFAEEKTAGLRSVFAQLAELQKQPESEIRDLEIELLKSTIETLKEI